MALFELTDEEVRDLSREEKDRRWLVEAFSGDRPQLTLRSALTGMLLGGLLSLTNIYVGYKSGWTLGIGITSVIMSFALFAAMAKLGLTRPMTILENNAMQSVATSAGYVLAPLFSSIGAYMMITGEILPQSHVIMWLISVSLLGVLFAFPLKRRFINEEQYPFPEGKAAGVVMEGLHTEGGGLKVKLLMASMGITAFLAYLKEGWTVRFGLWRSQIGLPELLDAPFYKLLGIVPKIRGFEFEKLTIGVESDFPLMAAGGLMGMRIGVSLLVGGIVNYFFLAPWLMSLGIIPATGGYKAINTWSVWFGAALITSGSLTQFFSKPTVITDAFRSLSRGRASGADVLAHIELPLWVSYLGVPVIGTIAAVVTHRVFGVPLWAGFLAIPVAFVISLIATYSTALTSITPTGALGKLTQLTYSAVAPGQAVTNLMGAGVAGEAATNTANLLMDIKPGYMLGAKPRQQAMGHVLGIFAGAIVAVPVWYLLFQGDVAAFGTTKFPMPGAVTWKAVADVLAKGFSALHSTAIAGLITGLVLGVVYELVAKKRPKWCPLSSAGFGLAFVMPFTNSMSMFLGGFVFWVIRKRCVPHGWFNRVVAQNQDTICGGGVAGGSITTILFQLAKLV